MRLLMPIILFAASVGLFVMYTNPTYQNSKVLAAQSAQYDQALTQSSELRKIRDNLLNERNAISTDNLRSLELMLPNNVDNIRLIIDINDIAARDGLQAGNISVNAPNQQSSGSVGASAGPVGSVDLSFDVQASYPQFLTFLSDLEHSLRLIDVEKITFTAANTKLTTYHMQVRTYWLQ